MVEAAVGLQDVMTVARATRVKEMHNRELISEKKSSVAHMAGGQLPTAPPPVYIAIGLLGAAHFLRPSGTLLSPDFLMIHFLKYAGSLLYVCMSYTVTEHGHARKTCNAQRLQVFASDVL